MGGIEFGAAEVATVTALLGALTGAITFLFKALISSKDNVIHELLDERNYWRDMAVGRIQERPPDPPRQQGYNYPPR